jgi:hypothetical protein
VAKLTEEQRAERALRRARQKALDAEEDDRRQEARHRQWEREGTYMTWAEFQAGEPCRGCRQPLLNGARELPPPIRQTPEERAEAEQEEARYRQLHGDCRSHRWSVEGSRTLHCGYCCPMPPLSGEQIATLRNIFASARTEQRKRELDDWDLTLTCDHVVRRTQHRDHSYWSGGVTECSPCGTRRGVVHAQRIGPAGDTEGSLQRERLASELQAEMAKLEGQKRAAEKTERKLEALRRQLEAKTTETE